jgi:hypothetical protein
MAASVWHYFHPKCHVIKGKKRWIRTQNLRKNKENLKRRGDETEITGQTLHKINTTGKLLK